MALENSRFFQEMGKGDKAFWCPGCKTLHLIESRRSTFTGTPEKPTVRPAISTKACTVFVTDGLLEFFSSSLHPLAGKTVSMVVAP